MDRELFRYTSMVSILVDGSPSNEFKLQKGLRQENLLAPFGFVIVAEGLRSLMKEVISKNLFSSYRVGRDEVEVNLLQFADDTINFGEVTLENVITIKCIMRCFELVSSLKVNFSKISFGAVGVESSEVVKFARLLNCSLLTLPFTYLGMPIGANPRRAAAWKSIIGKFKKKLVPWKYKSLSYAGRICLINSILSSLPIFYISFFKMPSQVAREIKVIQRKFL